MEKEITDTRLMDGNQAVALEACRSGCCFGAGYSTTPVTLE